MYENPFGGLLFWLYNLWDSHIYHQFNMERVPLNWMQKRCLKTYVHDAGEYFPVNRISQIMKNRGILNGPLPVSLSDLVDTIHKEGNIAYAMFRSLVAKMASYEMSLCLHQESELYRWVWISPRGDIVKRSNELFKNEDACLNEGYIKAPSYVHVCLEIVPDANKCIILV